MSKVLFQNSKVNLHLHSVRTCAACPADPSIHHGSGCLENARCNTSIHPTPSSGYSRRKEGGHRRHSEHLMLLALEPSSRSQFGFPVALLFQPEISNSIFSTR